MKVAVTSAGTLWAWDSIIMKEAAPAQEKSMVFFLPIRSAR